MVKIKKHDGYIVFSDRLIFVYDDEAKAEALDANKLILSAVVGEDMTYDNELGIVDYPGEYELQGVMVKSFADKQGKMNYIVDMGKQSLVIVQSTAFLEKEDSIPESVNLWVFSSEKVKEYWEKCEFEGDYFDLSNPEAGVVKIDVQ